MRRGRGFRGGVVCGRRREGGARPKRVERAEGRRTESSVEVALGRGGWRRRSEEEGGLLRVGLAVEGGGDEVAGADHFESGGGAAAFF